MSKAAVSINESDSAINVAKTNVPRPRSSSSFLPSAQLPLVTGSQRITNTTKPLIQPKLKIGAPNNKYEQEADWVADQVMKMPEPSAVQTQNSPLQIQRICPESKEKLQHQAEEEELIQTKPIIQRQPEEEEEEELIQTKTGAGQTPQLKPETASQIQGLRGVGQALDSSTRAFMEPRFGQDFSQVRVHADNRAADLARSINARAFTVGRDVVFGTREYFSGGTSGRRLLAHELTHVVQQNGGNLREEKGSAPFILKLHQERKDALLADGLQAKAFTYGNHIFLGSQNKISDRHLMAHELEHVIQQKNVIRPKRANWFKCPSARDTATSILQRQPAPAAPAAAIPAGRAAIAYLPTIFDKAPAGWGVTTEDDAIIDITAYASGGVWRCKITTATQQAHQGVRLLPGVVEVTAALVAGESNCATLKTMSNSLKTVANQGTHSGYYMLSAVQAHENLHITQYRTALNPHFTTHKTTIEALTVPLPSHANATAAKTAIKALPAYTTATATFHAADVAANNATAAHSPMAPFSAAEHVVVGPRITTINARRTTLKCPP